MKFWKLASVFLGLTLSFSSQAAFINMDWQTTGDNLIVQDTDTGLSWLRLGQSLGRSYNDVNSQFGTGGDFEGLRYATLDEAQTMFTHMGLPVPTSSMSNPAVHSYRSSSISSFMSTFDSASTFFGTLSDPWSGTGYYYNYDSLGMIQSAGGQSAILGVSYTHLGGTSTCRTGGFISHSYECYNDANIYRTGLNADGYYPVDPIHVSTDNVTPVYASWLVVDESYVSTVPVPAAAWLFGSGLVGLVGVARRKKS